jgi:hypothetical protein
MGSYRVIVTETLQMDVKVEAVDEQEAKCTVEKRWCDGKYVLGASNFKSVTFTPEPYKGI